MTDLNEVAAIARVPVSPGWTPSAWIGAGTLAAILGFMGIVVKQLVPWRKQKDDADAELRKDLMKRVEQLEASQERERVVHAAERALDRHKINNLTQCLDAVLMILEKAPDKTVEVVAEVRAMREAQKKDESAEAAAIHAAKIIADPKVVKS